jgi:hypothetical protein
MHHFVNDDVFKARGRSGDDFYRYCKNTCVILFLHGLVLGAAVATALTHVYTQNEVKSFSHDLAFLQARLRTLVRLAEAGLIKPDTVEAANVLNEVHDMVWVAGSRPVRESVNVVAGDEDEDGPVPSVFR